MSEGRYGMPSAESKAASSTSSSSQGDYAASDASSPPPLPTSLVTHPLEPPTANTSVAHHPVPPREPTGIQTTNDPAAHRTHYQHTYSAMAQQRQLPQYHAPPTVERPQRAPPPMVVDRFGWSRHGFARGYAPDPRRPLPMPSREQAERDGHRAGPFWFPGREEITGESPDDFVPVEELRRLGVMPRQDETYEEWLARIKPQGNK